MINKSWFRLELYTPTPKEVTEDFVYENKEVECLLASNVEDFSYSEEENHYMSRVEIEHIEINPIIDDTYINEKDSSTYENTVEVIHIEHINC